MFFKAIINGDAHVGWHFKSVATANKSAQTRAMPEALDCPAHE